jgi:hypothetical protein
LLLNASTGAIQGYIKRLEEQVKTLEIHQSLLQSLLVSSTASEQNRIYPQSNLVPCSPLTPSLTTKVEENDCSNTTSLVAVPPLPEPIQPEVQHIEWFFSYAYAYLPVFHSPTFVHQILKADTSTLYAMAALGFRYQLIKYSPADKDFTFPDALYKEAKVLMEKQLAYPNLATLQTLVVLEAYAVCQFFEYFLLKRPLKSFLNLYSGIFDKRSNNSTSDANPNRYCFRFEFKRRASFDKYF